MKYRSINEFLYDIQQIENQLSKWCGYMHWGKLFFQKMIVFSLYHEILIYMSILHIFTHIFTIFIETLFLLFWNTRSWMIVLAVSLPFKIYIYYYCIYCQILHIYIIFFFHGTLFFFILLRNIGLSIILRKNFLAYFAR